MSDGNTSYQIDLGGFSGKELELAKNIKNPVSRYRTSVGKRSGGMKGRFRRRQRFGYNFKRHTGNLAPSVLQKKSQDAREC